MLLPHQVRAQETRLSSRWPIVEEEDKQESLVLTDDDQSEEEDQEPEEFTYDMPTGTGKTHLLVWELNEYSSYPCLAVFPRLALLSQFYRRHHLSLLHRYRLIVCTDQRDVKDTATEDCIDHYEGKEAKRHLDQVHRSSDPVLVMTTYASLENVLRYTPTHFRFRLTVLDEAHHRSEPNVSNVLEQHRNRLGCLVNFSATPSEDCEGDVYRYPFRHAIDEGVLRDFTVHFVYIDTKMVHKNMATQIYRLVTLTGNHRCMAFTAYAHSDKQKNRHNVVNVTKTFEKAHFSNAYGITGTTKPEDRRRLLKDLENATSPSVLVSCRTLGEGIDVHGVNSIVFWDPRSSRREIIQIIGRALRPYRDPVDGHILSHQPPSDIILPIPIDVDTYQRLDSDEARDAYLREQVHSPTGGCYETILNVASALKEVDPEMIEHCMYYPSGPSSPKEIEDIRQQRQEQGFRVEDIPADGNCFFRCLEKVIGTSHQEIRTQVVDRLLMIPESERVHWGMEDNERVRDLYTPGCWTNDVMDVIPWVAAKYYHLDLSIYTDRDTPFQRFQEGKTKVHLQLLDNHYQRMVILDSDDLEETKNPTANKGRNESSSSAIGNDEDRRNIIGDNNKKNDNTNPWSGSSYSSSSNHYRRRFRTHIDPSCRVVWKLCGKSLDRGLAIAQHSIIDTREAPGWEDRFREVEAFLEKNPNQRPSSHSKDEDEKKLGLWVGTQLKNYKTKKHSMADETKRQKWQNLVEMYPIAFHSFDDMWEGNFSDLKAFLEKTPNQRPSSHSKNEDEKKLGSWVCNQLKNYKTKKHSMADETKRQKWQNLVEMYPIAFHSLDDIWEANFSDLEAFLEKTPNQRPSRYSKDEDEKKLGIWVGHQLKNYKTKKKAMADETKRKKWQKLVEMYPIAFQSFDDIWEKNYSELEAFLEKTPNQRPSQKSKDEDEKKLGIWVGTQLKNYKTKKQAMADETKRKKWQKLVEMYPIAFYSADYIWEKNFSDLEAFLEKSPNQRPSQKSKDATEKKLGIWVGNQLHNYKTKKQAMADETKRKKWKKLVEMYPDVLGGTRETEAINHFQEIIENDEGAISSVSGGREETKEEETNHNDMIVTVMEEKGNKEKDNAPHHLEPKRSEVVECMTTLSFNPNKDRRKKKDDDSSRRHGKVDDDTDTTTKVNKDIPSFPPSDTIPITTRTTPALSSSVDSYQSRLGRIRKEAEAMGTEELRLYYERHREQEMRAREKSGEYYAPNKAMKQEINHFLFSRLPKEGILMVLDAEDFGTSTVLGVSNACRLVIPQRDEMAYRAMKDHPVFGSCVRWMDLAELKMSTLGRVGLMYADLMGSLRELHPLLWNHLRHAEFVEDAVVAATVSCREGPKVSEYTNQFSTELVNAMWMCLGSQGFQHVRTWVYGEHVRMATTVFARGGVSNANG